MEKLDWKKDLKQLYFPPAEPVTVEVPALNFLMFDGYGDPNTSPLYQESYEVLYGLSYTLKFTIKKELGIDYAVYPPEGLWWAEDMTDFQQHKDRWIWTMMIAQPAQVSAELVERARAEVLKKKGLASVAKARFETFSEGRAAQIMHTGPFADEGPNIAKVHAYIAAQGCQPTGKHHEIYLSDLRRTAPERLKTVIRQPY